MATIDTTIATAAANPKRVTVDGSGTVEGQPLQDLLAVQQAQAATAAKAKNHCGFIFRTLEPGGCG
ncbi:MAG: hypothetical protein PHU85_10645 [Phycisphaerae bacterium]|nr:hypothetical protein [Phycisphaerae bacterium]